ncbi:MAG: carbonic anhydrase family protein [Nitrospirota bacterium]
MALPLTLSAVSCTHWGYEETSGPEYWAQLSQEYAVCGEGRAQSPIDITDAIPSSLAHPQFFYQSIPLRVRNTGHTIQVEGDSAGFMQVGTSRYDLVELHFHRPSGHKVNGRSYDMEVHLVHRGIDGERAVVGVFMEISERDNPVIKKMWDYLPADDREEHLVDQGLINPEELLPANRSFYHYSGSLTTPPCSEGVKWYIMKHLIKVSEEQVAWFSSLYRVNARPVQPSNGRVIQSSIR